MSLYRNLLANTVFVFGSNIVGKHVDEVASFAAQHFNAESGVGEGPTGKSYAVPVKDENFNRLPLSDVQWHVEQLLAYARSQRDARFQVTRIGCDPTGFTDAQIAPLFKKTSDNLFLPGRWLSLNRQLERARLFVDGADFFMADRLEKTLNECTQPWGKHIEVVTTGMGLVNDIVRSWARRNDFAWTPFLVDTQRYDGLADVVLDEQIGWYCTHAIGYYRETDETLLRRMNVLQKEGLKVRHFHE